MTGGAGLYLRSCANTSCAAVIDMPNGTVMQVTGAPTTAAGYTWWSLAGTVGGVYRSGWAVQDYPRSEAVRVARAQERAQRIRPQESVGCAERLHEPNKVWNSREI